MWRSAGRAGSGRPDMGGVRVDKRGPLFDGRAERDVALAADTIEKRVAVLGASMIRSRMNQVFKTQTPYARFRQVAAEDPPGWKIWDQGLVYGPWLEGIGRRNYPVTRFKGYRTYRIIIQELQHRATAMGAKIVAEFVNRW